MIIKKFNVYYKTYIIKKKNCVNLQIKDDSKN